MTFSGELAEIRFGYGLSPTLAPPASVDEMLAGLAAPDAVAERFPLPRDDAFAEWFDEAVRLQDAARKDKKNDAARAAFQAYREQGAERDMGYAVVTMLRATHSPTAFRERLTAFWADHFTAYGKFALLRGAVSAYVETAIRPRISGRFEDLLIAAVTHPLMLHYLDQIRSAGPGSPAARKREAIDGLNENLAREVLELHTLGVGGSYTQDDVRQLAELFTGMSGAAGRGFQFRPALAEPGAETVLGKTYGGEKKARLDPILEALRDIARHPETATHIATKLATHFVSDAPPPALVDALAARYRETGGDLAALYAVLLGHPDAWTNLPGNVKPPVDFMASSWRALAVPETVQGLEPKQVRRLLVAPLDAMGQPWQRPAGPDGWPEPDSAWITPQGVAMRLRWAVTVPRRLLPELPDPRLFVDTALGPLATEPVRFAAQAAESPHEAIGLVLASPAFQRR